MVIDEKVTFVHEDDLDLYNSWDSRAFEVQVANHELLGHGSGKLFQEDADGKKNFDPEKVINPLTGQLMYACVQLRRDTRTHQTFSTSWYKPGQTPGSVLGEVSSSLEEMRAEAVALYRALVRSSSGERLLTIMSRSGRKQRNPEAFQGLSRNGEDGR